MTYDIWIATGQMLLLRSPTLIVGVVGLWLSLARRKLHPRVSIIAAVGFGCQILTVVLFLVMQASLQIAVAEGRGLEQADIIVRWNSMSYVLSIIASAAIALAVFIDRGSKRNIGHENQPNG